ncbi:MAG: hypothetical protein AAB490_04335, partial [Patescibacteria group bacterium]
YPWSMRQPIKFLIVLVAVISVGIVIENGVSAAQPEKAKGANHLVIVDPMIDQSESILFGNGKGHTTVLVYKDRDGNTVGITEVQGRRGEPDFQKGREKSDVTIELLMRGAPMPIPAGSGTTYCTRRPPLDCTCLGEYTDCQSIVVN